MRYVVLIIAAALAACSPRIDLSDAKYAPDFCQQSTWHCAEDAQALRQSVK